MKKDELERKSKEKTDGSTVRRCFGGDGNGFGSVGNDSNCGHGRETAVKDLVEKAQILEALKEIKDRETLQRFCRYMEALVAYFKFYGGKD